MEDTIVKTMTEPLPHGRRFQWYLDLNLLLLSPCLTCEEREQAITEAQDEWRRRHIRVLPA